MSGGVAQKLRDAACQPQALDTGGNPALQQVFDDVRLMQQGGCPRCKLPAGSQSAENWKPDSDRNEIRCASCGFTMTQQTLVEALQQYAAVAANRDPGRAAELLAACNGLARQFYSMLGHEVPEGYRFDNTATGSEQHCWMFAVVAFGYIAGEDVMAAKTALQPKTETA